MGNRFWRIALRVVLAASLLLNAVALGVVLRAAQMRDEIGFQGAALPREVRRAFLERAREDEALLAALRDLGAARRDLVAVGTSSPLDEAALDDALEAVRSRAEAVQAAARAALREAFVDASR